MPTVAMTNPNLPDTVIYVDTARTNIRVRSGWEIREDLPNTPPVKPRPGAAQAEETSAPPTAESGDTTKEQ